MCSVVGCEAAVRSRGLCGKHYRQAWRSGDLEGAPRKRAEWRTDTVRVRQCRHCGEDTEPSRHAVTQCARCRRDSQGRDCAEPDCDRPVRARDLCSMHYKRLMRATGAWEPEPWDDRRRNNYHKRRALKAGSTAGPAFTNADVYERDGWVCGLCSESVSPDVAYPDPLSASLDHVVPLSLGGAHSLENVQLAHLSCNVRKGARVVEVGVSV